MNNLGVAKANKWFVLLTALFIVGSFVLAGWAVTSELVSPGEEIAGMSIMQFWGLVTIFVSQIIFIGLPAVLLNMRHRGDESFAKALKLNPISNKTLLLSIGMVLFFYPIAIFLNTILTFWIPSPPVEASALGVVSNVPTWVAVLGVSILPGVFEELLFRGFFMRAYGAKKSPMFAILMSSGIFAIFHFQITNLVFPFLLGVLLGYFVYATNSIWPAIVGHLASNLFALTLFKSIPALGEVEIDGPLEPSTILVVVGVMVVSIIGFIGLGTHFWKMHGGMTPIVTGAGDCPEEEFVLLEYEEFAKAKKLKSREKRSYFLLVIPGVFFLVSAAATFLMY